MSPSAPSSGPRILLYSHDGFGLGHLRRNLNVAGRLMKELPEASAVVVAGLPGIPGLELPEGVDVVKLPSIRKVATETWHPRTLRVEGARLQDMRRAVLDAVFDSFAPQLVLVDYLPAGVWGELVAPLGRLPAETQVVLGLRDILDAPEVTREAWREGGHAEALRDHYDRVLVYGDPEFHDTSRAYGLDEVAPGRVHYTGYLCSDEQPGDLAAERRRRGIADDERLVLVTAGGGADAFPMMSTALRAARARRALGRRERTVAVTGPLMPLSQVRELEALAEGEPVEVLRTSGRLVTLMAASDLVVTMAAYNTLTDALRLGRRVVCVPRSGPSAEQVTRARLLEEAGLLTRVDAEAPPSVLAWAMDQALAAVPRTAPPPRLDGLERTVSLLAGLLAGGAGTLRPRPASRSAGSHA